MDPGPFLHQQKTHIQEFDMHFSSVSDSYAQIVGWVCFLLCQLSTCCLTREQGFMQEKYPKQVLEICLDLLNDPTARYALLTPSIFI